MPGPAGGCGRLSGDTLPKPSVEVLEPSPSPSHVHMMRCLGCQGLLRYALRGENGDAACSLCERPMRDYPGWRCVTCASTTCCACGSQVTREVNADGPLSTSCQWKRTRREQGLVCSMCNVPIPGRMNHWGCSACALPACG
eukprot:3004794-Prorocentrum_lima.AAC.1